MFKEPQFVKGGIYKVLLTDKRRFTGYCDRVSTKMHPKYGRTYVFRIGFTETKTDISEDIFIIYDADVKTATRMSPRYVESIETNGKQRYKALFKYGEE
jgi:hypothetical protein